MKIVVFFSFFFLSIGFSSYAGEIPRLSGDSTFPLGSGYLKKEGHFTPPCVEGKVLGPLRSPYGSLSVEQKITTKQMRTELGVSGNVDLGGFFLLNVNAGFNVRDIVEIEKYSDKRIYKIEIYGGSYIFENPLLSERGKKASKFAKDPEFLKTSCGNEYVSEIHVGGKLYAFVHFDFSKKEHYQYFRAHARVKIGFVKVSFNVELENQNVAKDGFMTINLVQTGGNPDRLKQIKKPLNLTCSLLDKENCLKNLKVVHDYITTEFPEQLGDLKYDHKRKNNFGILSYKTQPYLEEKIEILNTSLEASIPDDILRIRSKVYMVNATYQSYLEQLRALGSNPGSISKKRSLYLNDEIQTLMAHTKRLGEAQRSCRKNFPLCRALDEILKNETVYDYRYDPWSY